MNNEKFTQLFKFLEESIRLKAYLINFLYYISNVYHTIKELNVYSNIEFARFANRNAELFYRQLIQYKDFEEKLENFLLENNEIDLFLMQNKLDFATIKTHFEYYHEIFSSLESEKVDEKFIKSGLDEYIELIEEEIIAVNNFKSLLEEEIKKLEICYLCKDKNKNTLAFYTCTLCGKNVCKSHLFKDKICIKCSEKIVDDYIRDL